MNFSPASRSLLRIRFPSSEDPLQTWAIGTLYAMAFFSPFSIAMGQIFQALMLFVVIAFLHRHWESLKRSPLLWLTGAYIVYILVRAAMAALIEAPEMAGAHWEETFRWLRSGPVAILMFALALAASGNWLRHSLGAIAALFLGFLVALAEGFDPGRLMDALHRGARYKEEVNLFIDALKLVAVILGLFAFAPLFLRPYRSDWLFALRLVLWLALLAGAGTFLLATQTRSLWIAGVVGLVVLGLCATWVTRGRRLSGHGRTVRATAL
ncbi:MAG: O-antigen ligase domain-containing protein, partial [Thiohalorhabdus sp.]